MDLMVQMHCEGEVDPMDLTDLANSTGEPGGDTIHLFENVTIPERYNLYNLPSQPDIVEFRNVKYGNCGEDTLYYKTAPVVAK